MRPRFNDPSPSFKRAPSRARAMRVLLLVALALAGCLASPDPSPATAADDVDVLPWGLHECRYLVAFLPVRADAVRPHLPEGFEPAPGLVPGASASLGVEAFSCAGGMGFGEDVAPMSYGSTFASVVPPEALAMDVPFQYVKWDTLVPDDARRALLVARGFPARAGAVTIEEGALTTATMDMVDVGAFTIQVAAGPEGEGGEGAFAEFTPGEGAALARWNATATNVTVASGRGVVTVPEGSIAADILGASTAPANVNVGTWSFVAGELRLRLA